MDSQKLGSFIAAMRKEKGLTQKDLAERLNVTDKAISKWERGLGLPDIKMIEPLADALGITMVDIMRGEQTEQEDLPTDQVSQVLCNVIDLATHHRKIERRNTIIACLAVAALVCAVFLIDGSGIIVFALTYMPFIMFGIGVILLISSFRRWHRKEPFALTLIFAILSILYPFAVVQFLIYGWWIGGGAPN